MDEAVADFYKRLEDYRKDRKKIETWLFNDYYVKITRNIPLLTGATKQFPTRHRAKDFSKNILNWGLPYTMKVYHRNKTGKPKWDTYTALQINDKQLKNFNNEVVKFMK